jgi:hypothetical protein
MVAPPTLTQKGLTLPVAEGTQGVKNRFVQFSALGHDNLIDRCL